MALVPTLDDAVAEDCPDSACETGGWSDTRATECVINAIVEVALDVVRFGSGLTQALPCVGGYRQGD